MARADMLKVTEAIDAFIRSPKQRELQQSVSVLFEQIVGSLSMLSFSRAADLFKACVRCITQELLEKRVLPDQAILDTLADVLAGLEQYLRALEENRVDRQGLLDKVQQSLATLVHEPIEEAQPQQIAVIEKDLIIAPLALTTRVDPSIAHERAAPAAETAQEHLLEPSDATVLLEQCEPPLSPDPQFVTGLPALEAQSSACDGCLTAEPTPEPVLTIASLPDIDPDLIKYLLRKRKSNWPPSWRIFRIGKPEWTMTKPCSACGVPSIP
jgi:predicted HTH domain antitoxin